MSHEFTVPGQVPQLKLLPHPLGITPQFEPWAAQVVGVQPQTLVVPPPPHVWGETHGPQFSCEPQPFDMVPQFLPCAAQVVGAHVQTLLVQVLPPAHGPQFISGPPQTLDIEPQFFP